jgi:hypothetical protein
MEVAVCPANPPRQVKVESETAFRTMPYARSSQYPNRLLTSLLLFEPLLPEMPLRLLLGQRYPQLIGVTVSCTSSISALSPKHSLRGFSSIERRFVGLLEDHGKLGNNGVWRRWAISQQVLWSERESSGRSRIGRRPRQRGYRPV